ncbi:hypothetical protein NQ314_005219 [Rhamnusium bicolor]|uniref:C2H2-type domain-containing protein n=1 Tax=Rhamnusium bicolor TaxID=1586634 RepID=A0AAV8ZIP2_9CUCU|nr:hypothetical protein NQ314_005219 [Rhamnusium bicolor]
MSGVMCKHCDKIFSVQSSLNRHLLEKHNITSNIISYDASVFNFKCLETNCNVSFKLNEELRQHLKDTHSHDMIQEFLQFANIQDFYKWLDVLRNTCDVDYVQPRGKRIV